MIETLYLIPEFSIRSLFVSLFLFVLIISFIPREDAGVTERLAVTTDVCFKANIVPIIEINRMIANIAINPSFLNAILVLGVFL